MCPHTVRKMQVQTHLGRKVNNFFFHIFHHMRYRKVSYVDNFYIAFFTQVFFHQKRRKERKGQPLWLSTKVEKNTSHSMRIFFYYYSFSVYTWMHSLFTSFSDNLCYSLTSTPTWESLQFQWPNVFPMHYPFNNENHILGNAAVRSKNIIMTEFTADNSC
jgi:hypothetical protein